MLTLCVAVDAALPSGRRFVLVPEDARWHDGLVKRVRNWLQRLLRSGRRDASLLTGFPLGRHEQTRVAHPAEGDREHDPFRPRLK